MSCPEITGIVKLCQLTKTSTWKQTGLVSCSLLLKLVESDPITNLRKKTFLQLWCSCMEVVELFFFSMAGKWTVVHMMGISTCEMYINMHLYVCVYIYTSLCNAQWWEQHKAHPSPQSRHMPAVGSCPEGQKPSSSSGKCLSEHFSLGITFSLNLTLRNDGIILAVTFQIKLSPRHGKNPAPTATSLAEL